MKQNTAIKSAVIAASMVLLCSTIGAERILLPDGQSQISSALETQFAGTVTETALLHAILVRTLGGEQELRSQVYVIYRQGVRSAVRRGVGDGAVG